MAPTLNPNLGSRDPLFYVNASETLFYVSSTEKLLHYISVSDTLFLYVEESNVSNPDPNPRLYTLNCDPYI